LGNRIRTCTAVLFALLAQNGWSQEVLPPRFVHLREVAPSIHQDIRYASPFNFTGQIVSGYDRAECILWDLAAKALARAQKRLLTEGLELKVYDCYRPSRAVRAFVEWSKASGGDAMKFIFYPALDKSKLFSIGYIALHSKHSTGIAVDVGLERVGEHNISPQRVGEHNISPPYVRGRCDGPFEQRVRESSLDLGTAYDCFSDRSATASPNISATARENRDRLRLALEAEGFRNYSREWWHYELVARSAPTYAYDFPVR
jgi:zinc D-Ala-D-Ala dipeptidase